MPKASLPTRAVLHIFEAGAWDTLPVALTNNTHILRDNPGAEHHVGTSMVDVFVVDANNIGAPNPISEFDPQQDLVIIENLQGHELTYEIGSPGLPFPEVSGVPVALIDGNPFAFSTDLSLDAFRSLFHGIYGDIIA